jgi:type IV secretory pathway VirJ component
MRPRRHLGARISAVIVALILIALIVFYALAGFFDPDPVRVFPARGPTQGLAAVLYSSDIGFRLGSADQVADAISGAGIPVIGFNSPALFRTHRSRTEANALFASSLRQTLSRTGASRVIVVGVSFGADMVRAGLAGLPVDMRGKVAGALLLAPGRTVFFSADPFGIRYLGTPDLGPVDAASLTWLPIECVQGVEETDSLCPSLTMANVRRTLLPGGHYLYRHKELLRRTVLGSVARIAAASGAKARP